MLFKFSFSFSVNLLKYVHFLCILSAMFHVFFYGRKLFYRPQAFGFVGFFPPHFPPNDEMLRQAWYLLVDRVGGLSSASVIVHVGLSRPLSLRPFDEWLMNVPRCWPYFCNQVATQWVWAEDSDLCSADAAVGVHLRIIWGNV